MRLTQHKHTEKENGIGTHGHCTVCHNALHAGMCRHGHNKSKTPKKDKTYDAAKVFATMHEIVRRG